MMIGSSGFNKMFMNFNRIMCTVNIKHSTLQFGGVAFDQHSELNDCSLLTLTGKD